MDSNNLLLMKKNNCSPYYYRTANEGCEGYIFTGVCLSIGCGGSLSRKWEVSVRGVSGGRGFCPARGLWPEQSLSRGISVQGVSVQGVSVWGVSVWGVSVQGGLCPGGLVSIQGGLCLGGLCPGGLCPGRISAQEDSVQDSLCLWGSLSGRG